ncbi:hypothetical protein J0S82_011562 [Galemys pyrenaicus]|uniref:Homeobox domain-containing protein n=1 Tax=Galemys pyrenaicus TaxID=202257 RepID=A0A8J6AD81_GALPY|nr:hypothetical protein J0S82_011562 [Galemys pyrenaicus]
MATSSEGEESGSTTLRFSRSSLATGGGHPKERTVYTIEQQQELKKFFLKKRYPTYQERLQLADRFELQEHQVQVWFKNQRAKFSKLQRLSMGLGWRAEFLRSGSGAHAVAGDLGPTSDTAFAQGHHPADPACPECSDNSEPGAPSLAPSNASPAFRRGPDVSNLRTPALAPSNVRPSSVRPSSVRPLGVHPLGVRPLGVRPSGVRPSSGHPSGVRPSSGHPSGVRPSSGRPSSGRPVFPGGLDFSNLGAPTLAPSSVGPVFPGGPDCCCQEAPTLASSVASPAFPGDSDLLNPGAPASASSPAGPAVLEGSHYCSPYQSRSSALFSTAELCVSSHGPAWVCPAWGVNVSVPATPAPGPALAPAWSPASHAVSVILPTWSSNLLLVGLCDLQLRSHRDISKVSCRHQGIQATPPVSSTYDHQRNVSVSERAVTRGLMAEGKLSLPSKHVLSPKVNIALSPKKDSPTGEANKEAKKPQPRLAVCELVMRSSPQGLETRASQLDLTTLNVLADLAPSLIPLVLFELFTLIVSFLSLIFMYKAVPSSYKTDPTLEMSLLVPQARGRWLLNERLNVHSALHVTAAESRGFQAHGPLCSCNIEALSLCTGALRSHLGGYPDPGWAARTASDITGKTSPSSYFDRLG